MKLTEMNQLRVADITYIRLTKEFVYLAVILDAFSRKVVGWALGRTLAARLPIAALEQAIAQRQPPPGLVHHKREEIYANDYRDLEHLLGNIEVFIQQYYNRCRLHSALGYRPRPRSSNRRRVQR